MRRAPAFALLLATANVAAAQRAPRFEIGVAPAAALTEGPAITSDGVLNDPTTREHLRNGFPARVHYRIELWRKGGVFDDFAGRTEWDVLVSYEPATQRYNMIRTSSGDQVRENFGGFPSVTSAEAELGRPFKAPLHPNRSGRYYYHLTVDVQTLTESDLDEVQQWLRGPTAPGKTSNPLTVIRSGLGTLFSRVLGGAAKTYERTSGIFTVE
jgi:hypothetical protein